MHPTAFNFNMDSTVDVAILGAGISGLSSADACINKNKKCAVFDLSEPGEGTSGAPGMLVNAATGRRAKKTWHAELGYRSVYSLLSRAENFSNEEFFETNTVLRPGLTQKLAEDFQRSIEKYIWPEGWIEWIDREQVNKKYPYINNEYGALLIKNGITVNGRMFIKACSKYLQSMGMQAHYGEEPDYQYIDGKWIISTNSKARIVADYLIDARGYYLTQSENWEFIPFHNIKGQTATFFYSDPLPLSTSISSLGYMAFMNKKPKQLTVGSTYEHDFHSLETDSEGLKYLIEKLENTLPDYSENYDSVKQWSGVRTTVPDRKPVIGRHPEISKLFVIGALGSKGLLLGSYVANELVSHIFDDKEIDREISSSRFF